MFSDIMHGVLVTLLISFGVELNGTVALFIEDKTAQTIVIFNHTFDMHHFFLQLTSLNRPFLRIRIKKKMSHEFSVVGNISMLRSLQSINKYFLSEDLLAKTMSTT